MSLIKNIGGIMKKDRTGNQNSNWKGGRIKADGYIMIYAPKHPNSNKRGYVFEHRLIMSQLIHRALYPDEVVHHIDENRSNNNPNNLMLERIGPHLALHNTGSRKFTEKDLINIKEKYLNDQSANAISKEYDCSAGSILSWLKKMNVKIKDSGFYAKKRIGRSKLTDKQWQELYGDYASGEYDIQYLVKKYGISSAMIPRGLKAHGYKIRSCGGGRKKKKVLSIGQ